MTIRQPDLYAPSLARVRATQGRLFDDSEAGDSSLACGVCGSYLVRTASGYLCCPKGHGRLIHEAALDAEE